MQPPDIVLIVLDTLRADRLSCYGHPEETTPNLDAFAEDGVLFERAISPAQWTIPAHGSLFTGEFPSTHGTIQIYDKHATEQITLAEYLSHRGYHTAGFCNNPLLGIVENDLDRGFDEFFNYGGVLPNRPDLSGHRGDLVRNGLHWLQRQLSRLNRPIQAIFTRDHKMLNFVLQPWLVAMWERNINFKGNTRQSLNDLVGYLRRHQEQPDAPPIFTFLNLMETHLPYRTPPGFSKRFAPTFHEDRQARSWLRSFNYRTYDWIAPITEPFNDAQHRVLNEMYNAEVAYLDHQLRALLAYLDEPRVRDRTLVIIMSDHGEGLDHHNYVGHSMVTYEDLVRVPLIVRYPPAYPENVRIGTPISTRRIFHTALEAAGIRQLPPMGSKEERDVRALSLRQSLNGNDQSEDAVWAEAFPPLTLVQLIEKRNPEAVTRFRCHDVRRALYDGTTKLITVADNPEEVYDVAQDASERINRIDEAPELAARMAKRLEALVADAVSRSSDGPTGGPQVKLDDKHRVAERLRRLGYME